MKPYPKQSIHVYVVGSCADVEGDDCSQMVVHLQVLSCNNRKLIDPLSICDCPIVLRGQDNLITIQVEAIAAWL